MSALALIATIHVSIVAPAEANEQEALSALKNSFANAARATAQYLALPIERRMTTTMISGERTPRLQDVLSGVTDCHVKAGQFADGKGREKFVWGKLALTASQAFGLCERMRVEALKASLRQCEQLNARVKSYLQGGQWTPYSVAKLSDWFSGDCLFKVPTENKPSALNEQQGQSLKKFCQQASYGADEVVERKTPDGAERVAPLRCEKAPVTMSGSQSALGKESQAGSGCDACKKWLASEEAAPALAAIFDALEKQTQRDDDDDNQE